MQRFSPQALEALLDAAPDALLAVDREGHIRFANLQAARLFGYDDLAHRLLEDLLPQPLAETHRRHRDAYFSDPAPRLMGERRVLQGRRADGGLFPVEVSLSPVTLDGETLVLCSVRDGGWRVRQQELLHTHTRLLARHNAELEGLTRALAGQVQGPARQVRQYAELFQSRHGADLDPAGRECLEALAYSARRIERQLAVLTRYLRLSSDPRGQGRVDLDQVLAEVQRRLSFPIEDREASLRIPAALPRVNGDPELLVELFAQLVDNALTHGGEGPWIVIRPLEGEPADAVVVSVRDNGPGIPEALRPTLFEPFVKGAGEGLGMGLAVARRIAEVHGGALWLEDAPGPGAEFRVRLPAAH